MNKHESLQLIGILSAAGLMHVQQDQADVWAVALDDIRFNDAMNAARELITYRTGAERWVTPADIRATVKKIRNATISRKEKDRLPPRELADDLIRERRWVQVWNRHVGDGMTVQEANHWADVEVLGQQRQAIESNGRLLSELNQYVKPRNLKTFPVEKVKVPDRNAFLEAVKAQGIPSSPTSTDGSE